MGLQYDWENELVESLFMSLRDKILNVDDATLRATIINEVNEFLENCDTELFTTSPEEHQWVSDSAHRIVDRHTLQ